MNEQRCRFVARLPQAPEEDTHGQETNVRKGFDVHDVEHYRLGLHTDGGSPKDRFDDTSVAPAVVVVVVDVDSIHSFLGGTSAIRTVIG